MIKKYVITNLINFIETIQGVNEKGGKSATLHEVLNMLTDLDVKDEEMKKIRNSRHLVPSNTLENPGRTALVHPSTDIPNDFGSDSYIVNFMNSEDLNWNAIKEEPVFYWAKLSSL